MDIVQMVREGRGNFDWVELTSKYNGYTLNLSVFRDAMTFDDIDALSWTRDPVPTTHPDYGKRYQGVRLPATAHELQQIADLLGAMLLTPRIIDLIWLKAKVKFDAVINTPYPSADRPTIVAVSDIHRVHQEIERRISAAGGGDNYSLVSCVGKYWCLINDLLWKGPVDGDERACNYGWFAHVASGPGLTPGTQCWQRPGYRHNKQHWDPSQTIRLMYRRGLLFHPDNRMEDVDLYDIASDPHLCGLITHDGKPLKYLRQKGVPELEPLATHGILPNSRGRDPNA